MRTGDIVDLTSERRLSAQLEFGAHGADVLVLNGGSRAEEIAIETTFTKPRLRSRRAIYCVDAGTSMQLVFPFLEGEGADDFALRLIAGTQEIVLLPPVRRPISHLPVTRGGLAVAAAAAFFIVGGGWLDNAPLRNIPEISRVSIEAAEAASTPHVALAPAPHLVIQKAAVAHHVATRGRPQSVVPVRVAIAPLPAPPSPRVQRAVHVATPRPTISDLRVPMSAKSGDTVAIAFHAQAKRVRIVASIGPTIVSNTTVTARNGVARIRSPKSDRDGRIMMVRAYAETGGVTSSQEAMVVLDHS